MPPIFLHYVSPTLTYVNDLYTSSTTDVKTMLPVKFICASNWLITAMHLKERKQYTCPPGVVHQTWFDVWAQRGAEWQNLNDEPLWWGHNHLKGSRYCSSHPLLQPCDPWMSAGRVVWWHCRGDSNLHAESLCISKEPRHQPTVTDHYLGPQIVRAGSNNCSPLLPWPPPSINTFTFSFLY